MVCAVLVCMTGMIAYFSSLSNRDARSKYALDEKISDIDFDGEDDETITDLELKKKPKPSAYVRYAQRLKVRDIDAAKEEMEETFEQAERRKGFSEAYQD